MKNRPMGARNGQALGGGRWMPSGMTTALGRRLDRHGQPQAVVVRLEPVVLAVRVQVPAGGTDHGDDQADERQGDVEEDPFATADGEGEEDEEQADGRDERPRRSAGQVDALGHRAGGQRTRHARPVPRPVVQPHPDEGVRRG